MFIPRDHLAECSVPPRAATARRSTSSRRISSALLIGPYQLGLANNVALHGLFELCLSRLLQVRQQGVKRVEFMEVAVTADRRTWSSVASTLPVIQAFLGTRGQRLDAFRQPLTRRRQIIEHPMH